MEFSHFNKEERAKNSNVTIENKKIVEKEEQKEISFKEPKFLKNEKEEKITASKKGTLIHLCLQKLDINIDYDLAKITNLLDELEMKKIITSKEKEAINVNKILEFTKSKIWEELKTAKKIEKEKPFYINIKAKDIYNKETDENILVQGIIDLYYLDKDDNINLVDYKTDYIENGNEIELINKYKEQLYLYKKALEQVYKKEVKNTYIYSVYLNKEIRI